MFNGFYTGKRILLTGHTGFKGGWLAMWLSDLGAEVHGLALAPDDAPNLHEVINSGCFASRRTCDIRDAAAVRAAVADIRPEVVFHLAAQALVLRSYAEPLGTFSTNALGTAHLLEAIRSERVCCTTVIITSDKCYENREWEYAYREDDALGGHDVYSMSKAATELVAQSWNRSFFLNDEGLGAIVTARAGNVIGGGDYSPDRLVPDCVRALAAGQSLLVRNPSAVRPWQHVLECLSGYLWLGACVARDGKGSPVASSFNFGPDSNSLRNTKELVEEIFTIWPGEWSDGSDPDAGHEATLLTLAIDKAAHLLDWRPVWDFAQCVRHTVEWYHLRHEAGEDAEGMHAFSRKQIAQYAADAGNLGLPWALESPNRPDSSS
jgi:CDP-glucose 4,6-dehydratase